MLNSKGSAAVASMNGQQFNTGYPSPTELRQPMSMLANEYDGRPFENFYFQKQQPDEQKQKTTLSIDTTMTQSSGNNGIIRTFPCTTCGKRFARRSDLARHGK